MLAKLIYFQILNQRTFLAMPRLSTLFCYVVGLMYLGLGLWCAISPEETAAVVGGIAGIGKEDDPVIGKGVNHQVRKMEHRLLGTRQRKDVVLHAEPHPEAPADIVGDDLTELLRSLDRRIAAIGGDGRGHLERHPA